MSQQTAVAVAPSLPEVTLTPGMIPAAIGAAFAGGVYAGLVRGLDGQPDMHLVLIDGDAKNVTWQQAIGFAASVGGELPTRREQRLLFANLRDQFDHDDWYWSSEQYAPDPDDAWLQDFDYGCQGGDRKSYAGRARAVRRLPVQ